MNDSVSEFDLFGCPLYRGKGRPAHVVTDENRNKIMMLLGQGWTNERIANALGVSLPTLKKHYFSVLKLRGIARDRLLARNFEVLWKQAEAGSVPALKEVMRIMEAHASSEHDRRVDEGQKRIGKKERRAHEAQTPSSAWADIVPPTNGSGLPN